jgi:hypothetical protein
MGRAVRRKNGVGTAVRKKNGMGTALRRKNGMGTAVRREVLLLPGNELSSNRKPRILCLNLSLTELYSTSYFEIKVTV